MSMGAAAASVKPSSESSTSLGVRVVANCSCCSTCKISKPHSRGSALYQFLCKSKRNIAGCEGGSQLQLLQHLCGGRNESHRPHT